MRTARNLPIIAAAGTLGLVAMLSFATANAQDAAQTCDATAAAYKALAAISHDPDVQQENANVDAAVSDCKLGHLDDGTSRINRSIARINDGVKTKN